MQKFFVKSKQIDGDKINIIGEDVNHIANVLRIGVKEEFIVGNEETGEAYICRIENNSNDTITAKVIRKSEEHTEPSTYIHLFQGLPKSDKMELIIQKCTELGVSEFTPVIMCRTITKTDGKDNIKKNIRWQKIAKAAAEQSKRDLIPKINLINNFKNIFEIIKKYDIVLVAYENENKCCIKDVLKNLQCKPKKIAIIIGPEGGLEQIEIDEIMQHGGKCVTLGKRILRTETAPIVMSTEILYEFDDLN